MLHIITCMSTYHKIPKISPGAYLFGWAYLGREIRVSRSIGLAL